MQISFPIVPVGTNSADSLPNSSATLVCNELTVGSSPNTSSPTSAEIIARSISGVGFVTVSLLKSIIFFKLVEMFDFLKNPTTTIKLMKDIARQTSADQSPYQVQKVISSIV